MTYTDNIHLVFPSEMADPMTLELKAEKTDLII